MLEEALRYPLQGEKGLERLFIGGVLLVLSVFVIPVFLVYGYLVKCLAAVAAGEAEPPAFGDWEALLVDGLKAVVVGLVYALVPIALMILLLVLVGVGGLAGGDRAPGLVVSIGLLGGLVVVAAAGAVAYVVMAALSTVAVEGELAAAFDLTAVRHLATSGPYLTAVVLAIVVQAVLGVALVAAVIVTFGLALFVLIPLGAFINFWVYLVTVYLFGAAYREAAGPATA